MVKKLFFAAVVAAFGMTACQKTEGLDAARGGVQTFTVSTSLPAQMQQTRSAGDGKTVNRCIMEVYLDGAQYGERQVVAVDNLTANFSVRLVAGKSYDFVFWADKHGDALEDDLYYNTASLEAVTLAGAYMGNNDEFDAFFASEKVTAEATKAINVELRRPFGQLNVKTLDMKEVADAASALVPKKVSVKFDAVPSGINLLTGELLAENVAMEYQAPAELVNNVNNAGELTVDYIFAPKGTEQFLADFTMSFLNDSGAEVAQPYPFNAIPVQRNYRTMVSGNLLTKKADVNVEVKPEFEDNDIDHKVDQVNDIAAANEAFANGATSVEITEAPAANAELVLPRTNATVSAIMPATAAKITVRYADGATDSEKPLNFTLDAEVADLEIIAPNTTVTISGAAYGTVTATTAANTLIVDEGTTVATLVVKQGNVDVYGTVEAVKSKPAGTVVAYRAASTARLEAFAEAIAVKADVYNALVIDADIDFAGKEFKIARMNGVTIDGRGHKISGYTVRNVQSAGLVCDAVSVKAKDLTLAGADVKAEDDGKGNAYAGALIGRSYGTIVLDNVKVEGSKVEGVNKVGAVIGFVAENNIEATGCSVEGCTVTTAFVENESGQCGGFAGYLGSLYGSTCLFKDCSVENSTVNTYMTRSDRTVGKFIGCFQGSQATDTVDIDNCSVNNVTLNGLDEAAASHISVYGDLLGGQRYGQGTVKITNSETAIMISSLGQLKAFAAMVNGGENFSKKTVKLGADIDLNNEEWTPIGDAANKFQGTFDGQGHTVSNLFIDIPKSERAEHIGFFGFTTNGEVKNLTLENADVTGYLNVGAVAGTPYASKYTNIVLKGKVEVKGYSYVGGMFGKNAYANLTGLTIDAEEGSFVNAQSEAYRTYVGGIVGFMGEGKHVVSNVKSNIDVTGSTCDVGGITGMAHYGNTFENCSCSGNVTLQNASDDGDHLEIGGIAGVWHNQNGQTVTFRGCSFTGTLSTKLNGEDRSAEVAESNIITGRQYSATGTGQLVIE